ncbi:methylated-DNA--[protein]-cysteine S-methyltransferase [Dyella halodurans]|uniref:Methylated-DNA--[protein]-cysteine S-methyltransferase n=1 Tax=Dyella halodurans TaxID=1920171 RepID=A0ABV9C101_9GAMM|nr:methylated-DNA--[protein]-cysteine S-methyltransferase [Dyella halodurans]
MEATRDTRRRAPAWSPAATTENLVFAIGTCSLGTLMVARHGGGICAILLGDSRADVLDDLQQRFPDAAMIEGDRQATRLLHKVVALVESPRTAVELPLDMRGTPFQQRVWQALRDIPVGSTTTYADIARRIGDPRAARAVAQACAANRLAIVIPCHRVVRSDGSLSGYRWGVERKRMLLQREARA